MQAARRQLALDFDAEQAFTLIHGKHDAFVAVCKKTKAGWHQKVIPHDDAQFAAAALTGTDDCYLSQAGYRSARSRTISNIAALTSAWVDLDIYNVASPSMVAKLTTELMLASAQARFPWMPTPSMVCSSGRGYYFEWAFTEPLPRHRLDEWQVVMDALVELFQSFGADALAKDASRVLRVVGTVNSKNGRTVTAQQTGPRIPFESFQCAILDAHQAQQPRLQPTKFRAEPEQPDAIPEPSRNPAPKASDKQRAQAIQPYQLALDRITDYHTLAEIRGPLMTDYRHRMLFCYAVSMVWYRSDVAGIVEELQMFAAEHFADAARYSSRRVQSVIDRLDETHAGVVAIYNGNRAPRRYRLTNRTIIAMLDIQPDEQRQLKTIISPDERNRRREERRRAKGVKPRAVYLATAEQRRDAVMAMREQGKAAAVIAAELGLSRGHVYRIIDDAQPDMFDVE